MFHSQYYWGGAVIHVQSVSSKICVCVHTHSIERLVDKSNKNVGRTVNAECQGNLSTSHFRCACHRFGNLALELIVRRNHYIEEYLDPKTVPNG